METVISAPVSLTASAVAEVKRLMQEPGFEAGNCLRLGVKGGGCSGMSYVLEFGKPEAGDESWDVEGVPVLMTPAHGMYLYGMEVDYQGGLNARGFVFHNPNATKTCGCGSSFAV
jgi:iron-sulfur cluster assembly accessory protein